METFDKSIEELRKQYYDAIKLLQDKKDILSALPKPDYKNFFPIMSELINTLKDEENELKEILLSEKDEDMSEYIKEILKSCMFKIEICKNLTREALETEEIEKEFEKPTPKNIIFAKRTSGKPYLKKDLKYIPEEYYESVLNSLIKIEEGYQEENKEKAKSFTSINKKLAGSHEIKPFKIRVIYKILDKDTAYVFLVRYKKDDNESLDRKEIIDRLDNTEIEFEKLKEDIKDKRKKEILIEEHKKIKEEISKYINKHKRGKKK